MRILGNYRKVEFDSLDEIRDFINNGYGDVMFYNGWTGDYYPIVLTPAENDIDEILVIGSDAFDEVKEEHLSDIYAYQRIFEIEDILA